MKFRPKKISYGVFVNGIFKFLQQDERNQMFYCSLFDPSSWEEIVEHQREFLNFQRITEERISELIERKNPKILKKYMKPARKREHFLASFVHSGDLCVFMLAAALEEKNVDVPYRSIGGQSSPDFTINIRGVPNAGIEVKRLISCSNLKERIDDEVISKLKERGINKLLLLLIFPAVGRENLVIKGGKHLVGTKELTKNVITYLLKKLGGHIEGRKKLMKLMFLVEHLDIESRKTTKQGTLGNKFFIYYYGVFSFDVMNSYDELVRERKVEDGLPIALKFEPEIKLDEKLIHKIDRILEDFGRNSGYDLEKKTLQMLGIEPSEKDSYFGKEIGQII